MFAAYLRACSGMIDQSAEPTRCDSCIWLLVSQVKVLIQHIEARQLLPPAVVLQALAPNSHLQLGVVKVSAVLLHTACTFLVTQP